MLDNHPQKKGIAGKQPYRIGITLEDVIAYRPDDPATHTKSNLVNAVADVLFTTKLLECKDIASYMSLQKHELAAAIKVELKMTFSHLVQQYRLVQVRQFLAEHPDRKYNSDDLAAAIGYSSSGSIARFLTKQLGITPKGRSSVAEDRWTKRRTECDAKWKGKNSMPADECISVEESRQQILEMVHDHYHKA